MTIRTTWRGPRAILEEAERILTELIDPPVEAASLVRDDDASVEPDLAPWLLHTYSEEPLPEETLKNLPSGLSALEQHTLPDRDWVASSLSGLGIVCAGSFVLFGRHDTDEARDQDGIKLQIEANQAFGTGHHPTTSGCLTELSALINQSVDRVLDIGTGSGVLALAARSCWSEAQVVATDIDETSIEIAKENAEINKITGIHWAVAPGLSASITQEAAPFDLVMANILCGPLVEMAGDIAKVIKTNGQLILAGLLDDQKEQILKTYRQNGFTPVRTGGTDRWPTLLMTYSNESIR